jgi:hypothetical protein
MNTHTTKAIAKKENALPLTDSAPLLPEPLEHLTADGHHPTVCIGFHHSDWTPPPRLTPGAKAHLPATLQAYRDSMRPADPDMIKAVIMRLTVTQRREDLPEGAWKIIVEDFIADLARYPADIIADAAVRWRRTNKFFPTISDMVSLCDPPYRSRTKTGRRLAILELVDANPAPNGDVTAEWVRQVMRPIPGAMQTHNKPRHINQVMEGIQNDAAR